MSSRLEWLTASATRASVVLEGEEAPDGQKAEVAGHRVLVLSHGDSYGAAIEGTVEELLSLLGQAVLAVQDWEVTR